MSPLALLPAVVLAFAAVMAPSLVRFVHPAVAARILSVLVGASAVATTAWLSVVAGGYLVQVGPHRATHLEAGQLLSAHGPVPAWLGMSAVTVLAAGVCSAVTQSQASRRIRRLLPAGRGVVLVDTEGVTAVAVPGRHPRILLSRSLLHRLPTAELAVVLAHERSHLRHRHGRYLALSTLAERLNPWLRHSASKVRLLLERWSDEDAAEQVADRRLVARAISRVALLPGEDRTVGGVGFHRSEVIARIDAMLADPPRRGGFPSRLVLVGTVATTTAMVGSALQLHHALVFLG